MNADQKRLLGTLLAVLGVAAVCLGGYLGHEVWEANRTAGALDEALGGAASGLAEEFNDTLYQDYTVPAALVAGGGVLVLVGFWIVGAARRRR